MAREHYEREQVEKELRGALGHVEMTRRYLEGDMLADEYQHDGASDALHALDEADEKIEAAAKALAFDPAELRRADL